MNLLESILRSLHLDISPVYEEIISELEVLKRNGKSKEEIDGVIDVLRRIQKRESDHYNHLLNYMSMQENTPVKFLDEKSWLVRSTIEPMEFIDAYPDEEYPIRILESHLRGQTQCRVSDNTAGDPPTNPFIIELNKASDERADLLRSAIQKLRRS